MTPVEEELFLFVILFPNNANVMSSANINVEQTPCDWRRNSLQGHLNINTCSKVRSSISRMDDTNRHLEEEYRLKAVHGQMEVNLLTPDVCYMARCLCIIFFLRGLTVENPSILYRFYVWKSCYHWCSAMIIIQIHIRCRWWGLI